MAKTNGIAESYANLMEECSKYQACLMIILDEYERNGHKLEDSTVFLLDRYLAKFADELALFRKTVFGE